MTRSFVLRLLESFFRHRWLNLLPILIMAGAGVGYVVTKPREYTTQGLIYVPGQSYLATLTNVSIDPASPWITPAQATANEIKELLQTDTFIKSIVQKSDLAPDLSGSPDTVSQVVKDVRTAVWAQTQGDNQVVVGSLHKNPVVAYQLTSAIIENYTQWKIDSSLAQSSVAQSFFADLIQKYQTQVDTARQTLNQYLLQHPGPVSGSRPDIEQVEIDRMRADLDQAQTRFTDALDKQEAARLAASQTTVQTRQSLYVVDAPVIPDKPTSSLRQTALQSGLFVVVGLLLSLLAIVGGALLDRGFLTDADVAHYLDLPVLANIPDTAQRQLASPRAARRATGPVVVRPAPALGAPARLLPQQVGQARTLSSPRQVDEPGPSAK